MSKWISVKDRLPSDGSLILLHHIGHKNETYNSMGWYENNNKEFIIDTGSCSYVTHWMLLPAKPEGYNDK